MFGILIFKCSRGKTLELLPVDIQMDDMRIDCRRNSGGCAPLEHLSEPAQFEELERISEQQEPEKECAGQSKGKRPDRIKVVGDAEPADRKSHRIWLRIDLDMRADTGATSK
jgi:hypothetical protein